MYDQTMGNCIERIREIARDIFHQPEPESDDTSNGHRQTEYDLRARTPRSDSFNGSITSHLRRINEANSQPLTSTEKKPERPICKSKTQAQLLDCSEIPSPNDISGHTSLDTTRSLASESSGLYFSAEDESAPPPVKRSKALKIGATSL